MKIIKTNTLVNKQIQTIKTFTAKNSFLQFGLFVLMTTLFALSANAATFTVNTLADNESNGCAFGQCTLREAVADAGNSIGSDTINFQSGLNGRIVLNGTAITIDSNVTINGPGARTLSVSGNNASRVFVVVNPFLGTATVNMSGLTVTDGNAQPILLGGTLIGDGGGIINTGGATLNLTEMNISGNSAVSLGGGIATRAILLVTTTTNITRSTISNNSSILGGGGISNLGTDLISSAVTTLTDSTVTSNSALAEGGGISNTAGTFNLVNDTVSHNQSTVAGGGIVNVAGVLVGTVRMRNTILAQNTAVLNTDIISSDGLGVFNSLGNNLIGNNLDISANFGASLFVQGTASPNANADLVGSVGIGYQRIDPLLGALQNNGGATNTRLPQIGSPAIDKGNNCVTTNTCTVYNPPAALTVEQRGAGFVRQLGTRVDIGATEGSSAPVLAFVVTSLGDDESDGCAVNLCTLREAVTDSNALPDANTITFLNGLSGVINLTNGQIVPQTPMTIVGPGARVVSVSGGAVDRVFEIATPAGGGDYTINISGLTFTNGFAQTVGAVTGSGGGILNGAMLGAGTGKTTLNLTEVNIANNTATVFGGGIATTLANETNITRSLINGNTSNATGSGGGGGLSNDSISTTTLSNSTVTNNTSMGMGGGILNVAGVINSTNNTISHNQAAQSGGGVVSLAGNAQQSVTTYWRNTIIAQNVGNFTGGAIGSDLTGTAGSFTSLGNNLIGDNFSAPDSFPASNFNGSQPQINVNGDLVGSSLAGGQVINPLLGNLQNNGGPTNSRLLSLLSPALNTGTPCVVLNVCVNNPLGKNPSMALTTDQRGAGYSRQQNSGVEMGATETPLAPTAAEVSISGRVFNGDGNPVSRATVNIIDSLGVTHKSVTNSFGYFKISGITAGETVVLQTSHKQYHFDSQILTPADDITDLVVIGFTVESKPSTTFEKNDGKKEKISGDF